LLVLKEFNFRGVIASQLQQLI